jgi:alcohol dehydrogenase (NADP+)
MPHLMPTLPFASGDAMPALGLGTWRLPPECTAATVRTALELGYRHLDGASIYGNEPQIGEALRQAFADGLVQREQLWITGKLWNDCHEPHEVGPALERSLADLGLEQLDLYLIHWPLAQRRGVAMASSPEEQLSLEQVPLAATWAAMEALVDQGLTRHIGVSNFSGAKLKALSAGARIQPEVLQIERHPLLQQNELLAWCHEHGVVVTGYGPLGSTGPSRPPLVLENPEVVALAAERGLTPAQLLLAWGIGCGTAVIPKSVQPARLAENLAAACEALDGELMARLARLDEGRRLIDGRFWCLEGGPYTLESLWDGELVPVGAE